MCEINCSGGCIECSPEDHLPIEMESRLPTSSEFISKLLSNNERLKAELVEESQQYEDLREQFETVCNDLAAEQKKVAILREAQKPIGIVETYTGGDGNLIPIAVFDRVSWASGKLPPVGTELFTRPQPASLFGGQGHIGEIKSLSNGGWAEERVIWVDKQPTVGTKLYAAPQPAQSSDDLLHDRPVAPSKAVLEKSVRNPAKSSEAKPIECTNGCPPNQVCDYCQGTGGKDVTPSEAKDAWMQKKTLPERYSPFEYGFYSGWNSAIDASMGVKK